MMMVLAWPKQESQMPRLREIPRSEVEDEYILALYNTLFGDRDPLAEPGTATGTPGNWWTVFAQVPDAFRHTTEGFGFYRSPNRKLDPKLRELGQIRAGYAVGSQFVYSQHSKAMRFEGYSEEQVAAIPAWSVSGLFQRRRAGGAGLYRLSRARTREGAGRSFRRPEATSWRSRDTRTHLHYEHLHDACGDEPGAAAGI